MNVEERSGARPHPKKIVPENHRERMESQNYEKKPIYRENREGGYQTHDTNRNPVGRRPRIKDSRRINYGQPPLNRPDEGNRRENPNRQTYPQTLAPQEKYPFQPRTTADGGGYEKPRAGGNNVNRLTANNTAKKSTTAKNVGNKPRNTWEQGPKQKYSHQKQLKYKELLTDPNEPIRLNKFLANAGVCSRREADGFIQAGVVKVNNVVITELGAKISRMDTVMFHDRNVKIESKVYIVLNKPKNCVTSTDDPEERLTVMKLMKNACKERIYPVGRLDRNTTGVLLLTNDGTLASKLTHPSFKKKKIYHVWLDKDVAIEDMEKIATGIELEDGEIHADAISYVNETDRNQVGIEIHSGRNRIVRRMFESLGYHVTKLDRVYFAGLTKKHLSRGKWRYLNEQEVNALRMGAFE